ncbi:MAG: PBP1A family penicillin-binding protein [Alphaproteobacteria bacterium]|nr:PBP1A family penicillin-binding protein [Alphaproteobacteria bacterium]
MALGRFRLRRRHKARPAKTGRWRNRVVFGVISVLVLALVGMSTLAYFAYTLPLSDEFQKPDRQASTTLISRDDEVFAMRGRFSGDILDLSEVPKHLTHAVLAIEDRRFYRHFGIDLIGMARAAVVNLMAGEVRQGGSTITQQLAKLSFLSPERTFKRKIQEVMIALWLERRLSKDEILVRYLNKVYFGAGAYGIDGAAQRYFNKSARKLTLAESAMLAGLIRAPSHLAPTRNLRAARARAKQVLKAMVAAGFIDQTSADHVRAREVKLAVNPNTLESRGSRYFADWVAGETRAMLGPLSADLTVETTLHTGLQTLAEKTFGYWLETEGAKRNATQGAMVVLSHDGAILAMVGGRDYDKSQFNRAAQARRQPGSLFKLFVYLAAFDAGMSPGTAMVDQPLQVGTWQPQNYGGDYRGEMTLRTAFADSVNSIAVQITEQVGRGRVIGVARSLGVNSPLKNHPSLALGASEVTLLEMTAAYAAMAADVKHVRPYGIRTIRGESRQLYRHQLKRTRQSEAMLPWKRAEMLDLLIATVDEGTGKAAKLPAPVAGKTGTTQDYRDAWFIGFTADIVVGIWLGNDDNTPMDRVTGGGLPARIWRDYVAAAYRLEGATPRRTELLAGIPPVPEPVIPDIAPSRGEADSVYRRFGRWVSSFMD